MKKYGIGALAILAFASCSKWTETQSDLEKYESFALNDLREKRDNFKWIAEAERVVENKEALEAYWDELSDYKRRSWLNGGDAVGQKPMYYFWYSADIWKAEVGSAKSWLQALPDSLTAISMWGGLQGRRPSQITENQKKDVEIFHRKGSSILMCWQTPGPGLGLPGATDGSLNGVQYFQQKYPFAESGGQWGALYARDLARYIIALNFDGYDVDWETCGDHGSSHENGTDFMMYTHSKYPGLMNYPALQQFVKEMGKYFGPVGKDFYVKTQEEREANLQALFNPDTPGFHENEKDFINDFKPHLPKNWLTKRYYFCADVPCGSPGGDFETRYKEFFDKHFMQDYGGTFYRTPTGARDYLGNIFYNSTGANYQSGEGFGGRGDITKKAALVAAKSIWGMGLYHGQTDFATTTQDAAFKSYLTRTNLKRNYQSYAWTREAIRIADPRPAGDYKKYKEKTPYIITP